jgi:hypothetical protein
VELFERFSLNRWNWQRFTIVSTPPRLDGFNDGFDFRAGFAVAAGASAGGAVMLAFFGRFSTAVQLFGIGAGCFFASGCQIAW